MESFSILIIDDHALFRAGLSMILKQDARVGGTLEASSVSTALARKESPVDLILLDIQLPGTSGLDGLAALQAGFVGVPIVILSASQEPWEIRRARQQGAAGFLHKAASARDILLAITRALRGIPCFPAETVDETAEKTGNLTKRQHEVLTLLCQGKPNKLIARELGMAENTVRVHVSAILAHLGAASRAEAILAARRQGVIDSE